MQSTVSADDKDKLSRKYNKQLKAIVQIEKKLAEGAELNAQQKEKLSKKGEIEAALKALK